MPHRFIAVLLGLVLALGVGGCASNSNRDYDEVLMPLQTGSVLQRRVFVRSERQKKPKKKKDEKKKASTPDAEPDATPGPDEEATPPPVDRFR
jgi:hypothetical protein